MSAFETWFVAQHGKRDQLANTDHKLYEMIAQGRVAEEEMRRRITWDEKYQAALCAWQAREATK